MKLAAPPGECGVERGELAMGWILLGAPFVHIRQCAPPGARMGMYRADDGTVSGMIWPRGEQRPPLPGRRRAERWRA